MREEDVFATCDDYLAWAAEETNVDKQMFNLERALAEDPSRVEDVLRVACGSQNMSIRTPGKEYIKKLEKLAGKKKRTRRKKKK